MPVQPIVGVMSLPPLGYNATWGCVNQAFYLCGLPAPITNDFRAGWWERGLQNVLHRLAKDGTQIAVTVDCDSIFTAFDLGNLLNCFNAHPHIDALAALQPRRGDGIAMLTVDEQYETPKDDHSCKVDFKTPIKVRTAHFGLTAIRLPRLLDIPLPWFLNIPANDGSWEGEGRVDADIYFWNKWHEYGRSLYVLPGVNIGHLEMQVGQIGLDGRTKHLPFHEWKAKWTSAMASTIS